MKCPEHWIHLLMGIITYFVTLYYSQMNYINKRLFIINSQFNKFIF